MTQASGSFTVASWNESTYQELSDNGKLTKATVTFGLTGDLIGEATWEAVMCYRPDGSATYTGMQRVDGQLGGIAGSFVVRADGEFVNGEARSRWQIIEGSGSAGLAGLTGNGSAVATAEPPGLYTLEYDLG